LATVLVFLLAGLLLRDHLNLPSKYLVIFYTSNLRGQISPFVGDVGDRQNMKVGGLAFVKGLINETIKKFHLDQNICLLLDTGDSIFGSAEASLTMGEAPFNLLAKTGYDAIAVGNMEFEFGLETLRKFVNSDKFAFLACNFRDLKSPLGNTFLPGKIFEKGGAKFGVIGLGHQELARNTRQENLLQIEITDMQIAVQKTAAILKSQGAELIILLSHHPGLDDHQDLAKIFPDVDVVIGDLISPQNVGPPKKPLVCSTAFARGAGLGMVKIPCIRGEWVVSRAFRNHLIVDTDSITPDPELVNEISKVEAKVDTLLEKVLAEALGDFKRSYNDESSMGDLITDCMRETAKTQIAFQNSGGIKIAFPRGPIALRDLYEMLPFENTIVKVDLPGWKIENLIENSLSGRGSFLQASGINCTYSSDNPPGFRVIQIGVGDEPIEWNCTYSVAVNDFMLENQLNWPELSQGENITVIGPLRENLKNFLEKVGSVTPDLDKRFCDIQDMDETLRTQAMSIDLASLSQPVVHNFSIESEYGRLLAETLRTETDSDFCFVPLSLIKGGMQPLKVVTPFRIATDIPDYNSLQTIILPGSVVQKIVETALATETLCCFAGFSIELKDGKLSKIYPWEGDFDVNREYKVAIPQNFPGKIPGFYDFREIKRTTVFSDLRRVFINGLRKVEGRVELRRAVY